MPVNKSIAKIVREPSQHWVGDGFPVRNMFSYRAETEVFDPFLLLDYAGPHDFPPAEKPPGVGEHPHRGFETVTIVYQGEIEHRDSSGNHGKVGPGDVQWMTAASGVVHEEFHSAAVTRSGGTLEMIQLWVNLPAKDKMSPPKYQEILAKQIPAVPVAGGAGSLRVIAGEYAGVRGPAETFTPIHLWDLKLSQGATQEIALPSGFTALLVMQNGAAKINDAADVQAVDLTIFERAGETFSIQAKTEMRALVLAGQPLGEPVVGQGPFVMNTPQEIQQAMVDYRAGRMGHLTE